MKRPRTKRSSQKFWEIKDQSKTCVACQQVLPANTDNFAEDCHYTDFLDTHCRSCRSQKWAHYRSEHRDQINTSQRKYQLRRKARQLGLRLKTL